MTTLNLTETDKKFYKDAQYIADKNGMTWEFKITLLNNLISGMSFDQSISDALYEWDLA